MRKIISVVLSFGLLFQQSGLLYAAGEINLANYLSQARNAIVQPDVFQPARLRYISYDMANNDFKLLLDKGNAKLNDATPELFNYFLIGLALPNDTFWVNLRPDAPENIIDPILEKTDIGKIFLEADLQLKKDTAGLTSPQNPEGKLYWDKLYKKAGELFGTENITIPTITRPWIVPNEVIVRETEDSAYIYKATLKVMLEQDHLKDSLTYNFSDPRLKELNEYSSQIIRETIIPKLTKEVNSSKRYAQLRQVYYSLILARWFKQKYSSPGSAGASANSYLSLIDSGNLDKLASKEPYDKQTYFQAYQKSFKDGEYNLKETVATPFGQSIRSYISGGISVNKYDIGRFRVGAESDKVYKALTSGSPILNLWGLFNKKNETKNPIKILYDGYKKSKDNDEPDVVADRMLNVIFHFNGGIDKKDIQKIIELLEKAGKIKPYFYKTILTIFNEAVKNWDDKSSIVEVRDRIRVVLDTFVIDKGEEIIKFINDFLSRNKNKKDGFVQELQEYINNKKKRGYDDYVVIANSLHYKRHQLEKSSELHDGQAGRKLHNFMTEISLFQGYDVVKYDKIVLEELTGISPTVDDMLIADFILNYSKLLFAGSPLEVRELIGKDMEGIADGLEAMNMIVRGFADYQEHNSKMGNLSTCLRDAQLVVNRIKRMVKPGQQDGISIAIILDTLNNLKEKLIEVEREINTLISLIAPEERGTELSADLSSLLHGSSNVSNRMEILYRKLQMTCLSDFLSALESQSESNKTYNEEAKQAISNLINTIKQQIELINEGKYHLVTRGVGKSIIEGDWKYLCSQMPGIEKTLVTKYNDVIKALASYPKVAGSPLGEPLFANGKEVGRYVSLKDLQETIIIEEAILKLVNDTIFLADGYGAMRKQLSLKSLDYLKNTRMAIRINPDATLSLLGMAHLSHINKIDELMGVSKEIIDALRMAWEEKKGGGSFYSGSPLTIENIVKVVIPGLLERVKKYYDFSIYGAKEKIKRLDDIIAGIKYVNGMENIRERLLNVAIPAVSVMIKDMEEIGDEEDFDLTLHMSYIHSALIALGKHIDNEGIRNGNLKSLCVKYLQDLIDIYSDRNNTAKAKYFADILDSAENVNNDSVGSPDTSTSQSNISVSPLLSEQGEERDKHRKEIARNIEVILEKIEAVLGENRRFANILNSGKMLIQDIGRSNNEDADIRKLLRSYLIEVKQALEANSHIDNVEAKTGLHNILDYELMPIIGELIKKDFSLPSTNPRILEIKRRDLVGEIVNSYFTWLTDFRNRQEGLPEFVMKDINEMLNIFKILNHKIEVSWIPGAEEGGDTQLVEALKKANMRPPDRINSDWADVTIALGNFIKAATKFAVSSGWSEIDELFECVNQELSWLMLIPLKLPRQQINGRAGTVSSSLEKQAEELDKELQTSAGSPIGVALPEGAPKSCRLVRFGNLSEPVKSSLLARTQDVFPESIISEIVTDNDAFVVELNDNGEINIVLGAWIKGMMNGIYIRNDLDLSSRNKKIISDTLNDLMAGRISVGSPLKEIYALDENYIKIKLKYGKFADFDKHWKGVIRKKIKEGLGFPVSDDENVKYLSSNNQQHINEMRFAVIITRSDIIIKGILKASPEDSEDGLPEYFMADSQSIGIALQQAWGEEMLYALPLFLSNEEKKIINDIIKKVDKVTEDYTQWQIQYGGKSLDENMQEYQDKVLEETEHDIESRISKMRSFLQDRKFVTQELDGWEQQIKEIKNSIKEKMRKEFEKLSISDELKELKINRFNMCLEKNWLLNAAVHVSRVILSADDPAAGKWKQLTEDMISYRLGSYQTTSSPAIASELEKGVFPKKPIGGIDLTDRALHIKLERVGSFASTPLLLPQVKNTQDLDLDREFEQVEALASSGIVPNSHRLLELFTICHYRGEFGERLNQIISCLKASSAIQEAQAIDSDEDFRLALMMPEVLS